MKKIDLNVKVYDAYDNPIGVVSIILAQSFKMSEVRDEHLIDKIDVFVEKLKTMKPFELDEADYKLFRKMIIECSAVQGVKSAAKKAFDKE